MPTSYITHPTNIDQFIESVLYLIRRDQRKKTQDPAFQEALEDATADDKTAYQTSEDEATFRWGLDLIQNSLARDDSRDVITKATTYRNRELIQTTEDFVKEIIRFVESDKKRARSEKFAKLVRIPGRNPEKPPDAADSDPTNENARAIDIPPELLRPSAQEEARKKSAPPPRRAPQRPKRVQRERGLALLPRPELEGQVIPLQWEPMKQGFFGNCYAVAALDAILDGKGALSAVKNGDTWSAQFFDFHNNTWVTETINDKEARSFRLLRSGPIELNAYLRLYARFLNKDRGNDAGKTLALERKRKKVYAETPWQTLLRKIFPYQRVATIEGGWPKITMRHMIGDKGYTRFLADTDQALDRCLEAISVNNETGYAPQRQIFATAATKSSADLSQAGHGPISRFFLRRKAVPTHAYSIHGASVEKQEVYLRNPWNTGKLMTLTFGEFKTMFYRIEFLMEERPGEEHAEHTAYL